MYDAHLHMGYLSDKDVVLPSDILHFTRQYNVCGGAIMPTACRGGHDDFRFHIELYRMAILEGFSPILYVTPKIISAINNKDFPEIGNFTFIGIKIHPDAVEYTSNDFTLVCDFAREHSLPVFIHTGGKPSCEAIRFENLIIQYADLTFVMCHARPSEQAFYLINRYQNIWIDTAFLPIEDISSGINDNNQKRILFGTDYPVNRWYPDFPNEREWYGSTIDDILNNLTATQSKDILVNNYQRFILNNSKQLSQYL